MSALKARVVNGRLVLDEPCDLPDETILHLVVEDEDNDLDDAERQDLHESLDRAWRGVKRGEKGIPAEQVIAELRKRG